MRRSIEIENIEAMRLRKGIDDVQLREAIRGLGIGDHVYLTLLTGTNSSETLLVRITSIKGSAVRGKVAKMQASSDRLGLHVGSAIAFTTAHIHSLSKEQPPREQ